MKNKGMDAGPFDDPVSFHPSGKNTPGSMSDNLKRFDPINHKEESDPFRDPTPWVVRETTFPHGTKFRGKYKGVTYFAKVDNGALVLNGKAFISPSAAAMTITRNPVDGWVFWDCKKPDGPFWMNLREVKRNS